MTAGSRRQLRYRRSTGQIVMDGFRLCCRRSQDLMKTVASPPGRGTPFSPCVTCSIRLLLLSAAAVLIYLLASNALQDATFMDPDPKSVRQPFQQLEAIPISLDLKEVNSVSPQDNASPVMDSNMPRHLPDHILADLDLEGVNSAVPLHNVSRVFYNRVPKCGSRTILRVLEEVTKKNRINNDHSTIYNTKQLTPDGEVSFASEFISKRTPMLHDRHLYFVDFEKQGHERPVYINLIRDPFERILSRHYYVLQESIRTPDVTRDEFNMTFSDCVRQNRRICMSPVNLIELVRYFCGQDPVCESKGGANNAEILRRAKQHVLQHYAVVGVIEDLDSFFLLLERRIPEFFAGASGIYRDMISELSSQYKNSQKIAPEADIRNYVISRMSEAYEFYQFIKQRQYNMLHPETSAAATSAKDVL